MEYTLDQVLQEFWDIEVEFYSYYKFSFTFKKIFDSGEISVVVWGDSDEIYKFKVKSWKKHKIKDLWFNYFLYKKEGEEEKFHWH